MKILKSKNSDNTTMETTRKFLGTWILNPEASKYEAGTPPRKGSYTITKQAEKLLFRMIWTDTAGQEFDREYSERPDGKEHPYENKQMADAIRLTPISETILESEAIKDGRITMKARRELLDDSTMQVTLEGMLPDGQSYLNISRYRKQE